MKHIFLSIFLMTAVSSDLFSQKIKFESIGIQGGPSLVFTTLDQLYSGNIHNYGGTKMSFHSGIQTDWSIAEKIGLEITPSLGQREFRTKDGYGGGTFVSSAILTYVSMQLVPKYKITKKLSAGIGLEPTFYFESSRKERFDIMLPVKVSYSLFSFMDLGLSYKRGLLNLGKDDISVDYRRHDDLQFSLYFPLFGSKPKDR